MDTITWATNFGGQIQIHCQVIIEKIIITDKNDIENAEKATEINDHQKVREIALKYTNNTLYKELVQRISSLSKSSLTYEETSIYQELIRFASHFTIVF